MSIRRYTGRSRSRRSNPRGEWRRNPTPLKPKQFKKRIVQLEKLGLYPEIKYQLEALLPRADASHATYVFDFWQARLALLRLVDEDNVEHTGGGPRTPQMEGRLVDLIQKWANKYFVSVYNCTLDEELQIDYYESLKHFIQLAANNPYFAASWAPLHRITFIVPPERWREEERHIWLGRIKGKTRLSNRMYGLTGYAHDHPARNEAAPAIKLLRGAYSGDPIGAERETEIPIELIYTNEKVMAPSDLIEYLTDMEENTVSAKFFVPKFHEPFMTFEDGKSWVIIHRDDKSAESRSLDDCGEGQHSSESIILLSLREPIPGTHPQQYKALLKAEVVFPSGTIGRNEYLDYSDLEGSVGIINQLRAHHNSKPGTSGRPNDQTITDRSLHKYIIPLLEEPWIAHFSRPSHRGERVFWPTDLTPRQIKYLKEKNEYLFNTQKFYETFKELEYPHRIREKLLDGLEFPISQVIETLQTMSPSMLRGRTIEERMVRTSLKRAASARERGDISDELLSLMDAAEQRILGIERGGLSHVDVRSEIARDRMRTWLLQAGAEISYPEIYRILKITDDESYKKEHTGGSYERSGRWHPDNWEVAISSLAKKIKRKDSDVAPLKRLGSKLLAAGFEKGLVESGVTLNINQLERILNNKLATSDKKIHAKGTVPQLRGSTTVDYSPSWETILRNLRVLSGSYMSLTDELMEMIERQRFHSRETALDAILEKLGDPWSNPYAKILKPVAPLLRKVILTPRVWRGELPVDIIHLPFSLNEEDITKILTEASYQFLPSHIPMYRAALISLDRKLNAKILDDAVAARKSKKRLTAVAKKFLLAVKDKELAKEASAIVELPMRDIIQVISAKRYNLTIRRTALASLRKRINRGDKALRRNALFAIKQLLSRTKNKSLINDIFNTYSGHKSRYELLYFLAIERIEWLSDNQKFFVELLESGLPGPPGYYGRKVLPKSMYLLFRKLILEEPRDYLSLVVKLLFQIQFNEESLKAVGRLIELALDEIIDDPNLLISGEDLCDWFQNEPQSGGWGRSGTTSHRTFPNELKLTPKLLRQFRILRNITLTIDDRRTPVADLTDEQIALLKRSGTIGERGTTALSAGAWDFILGTRGARSSRSDIAYRRSDCFLDLAVTIAQAMDRSDRAKMYTLIEPLIRRSMAHGSYRGMIRRLLD